MKKKTYAEVLRTCLEAKGMTQVALAESTRIPLATVRGHLIGHRELSAIDMWAYADALGVEPCVFKEAGPSSPDRRKKRAK